MQPTDESRPRQADKGTQRDTPKRTSIIPALALDALGILAVAVWVANVALVLAWWAL